MLLLLIPVREYIARLAEPRSVADVVLVFFVVYGVLKLLRGTRAAPMAAAIGVFAFLYWLAVYEGLTTLEFVLRGALLYIGVAIIVLFQTEIRQALITFGNRFRVPFTRRPRGQFGQSIYDEIVLAATTLASTKTGALIVIERNVGLKGIVDAGVSLDAELGYDLIVSIFNPASPLHDGAVIVRGDRIAAASCFLPLSVNPLTAKELGTRHRAALGITEDSDAVAIVVSEETGLVSFVRRGRIKRALDATRLRAAIYKEIEGQPAARKPMIDPHSTESAEVEGMT
ncbi:MAG TPA: TIGR00159 family protein [Blastocatellia bacterium]|nr:TIGR00159 family protein [Blastocatellia bacterium]